RGKDLELTVDEIAFGRVTRPGHEKHLVAWAPCRSRVGGLRIDTNSGCRIVCAHAGYSELAAKRRAGRVGQAAMDFELLVDQRCGIGAALPGNQYCARLIVDSHRGSECIESGVAAGTHGRQASRSARQRAI